MPADPAMNGLIKTNAVIRDLIRVQEMEAAMRRLNAQVVDTVEGQNARVAERKRLYDEIDRLLRECSHTMGEQP